MRLDGQIKTIRVYKKVNGDALRVQIKNFEDKIVGDTGKCYTDNQRSWYEYEMQAHERIVAMTGTTDEHGICTWGFFVMSNPS